MARRRLSKRHLLMLRWGVPCILAALVLSYVAFLGTMRKDPSAPNADGTIGGLTSVLDRDISPEMVRFSFDDVTKETGIRFRHFPATRQSLLPEDMGSGLAWGDYDGDGDPDLYLVNFHGTVRDPISPETETGRCALYRNDGDGRFVDVSKQAGVDRALFGMAAAWGDYDDDNDLDLYITAYGPNVLFRNDGNGSFTDVTDIAGVGDDRFSAGCAWSDYDRDGRIDLYVCTYVRFEYRDEDRNGSAQVRDEINPYTINPSSYPADANILYHNNGDGSFTDIAEQVGVEDAKGRSLGAVWFDFDNDQWIDLYVANDVSANAVYRNKGNGMFEDVGAQSLAADYRGAMGLAVCDYQNDGDFDLFVTHWVAQENAFYENMFSDLAEMSAGNEQDRPVFFADNSDSVGLGQLSLNMVGWAAGFADFDNDGHFDLWVVNGNTLQLADDPTQLAPQRPHVFRQQPPRGFFEIGRQACPRLGEPIVGRGGAHADYDGDGRLDLAIMVHGGEPIVLRNTSSDSGHWIGVRLRQQGGNTSALGARVAIRIGDRVQTAQVGADGSYLSQSPTDLHFGLADTETVDEITIHWPDGSQDRYENVACDQVVQYSHSMSTVDLQPIAKEQEGNQP
ncbi:MAG TPA: CRTAC1 family protein [Pirellulaceae bacterium]|nr:CRTAC1 family protein [Pirellulaceae bacterium]